jgi:hypothetical protein
LVCGCVIGNINAQEELNTMDELDLYGHRKAKKIIMCIRLYFPQMSQIHQMLFAAQRDLNNHIAALNSDAHPDLSDIITASGRIGHFLRLMEAE